LFGVVKVIAEKRAKPTTEKGKALNQAANREAISHLQQKEPCETLETKQRQPASHGQLGGCTTLPFQSTPPSLLH
jgi:hypothetical protein